MKKSASTLIISTFLSAILIGSFLLMLPFSTVGGSIAIEDAFFTSASAVTVTGLIVVDTATYFTPFGQLVILVLLQIGGLGFMTFSTFTIMLMGKGVSLKDKTIIENDFTAGSYKNLNDLLKKVVFLTFGIELTGAILLYFQFTDLKGGTRIFASVFHSISAFCNAGFSIFSNSFVDYISDWGINLVLIFLIIFGGIGFLVLNETILLIRKRKNVKKFSLHSKIVFITSGLLILVGFLFILIPELLNKNNMYSWDTQILQALFQSVSTRTAGFNTINFSILSHASVFVMIVLMFIGASPGSTGGGVKTTSLAVVLTYFKSHLKGKERLNVFYRRIPNSAFEKAFMVIMISFLLITIFAVLLFIFEPQMKMSELLFEAFSAFGTVGLSMGITSEFSLPSKLVLIMTMFIGRIGPLTLLIAISKKESKAVYHYPEESIMIG